MPRPALDLDELSGYFILVDAEEDGIERYQHFYKKMTDDFVANKQVDFKSNVSNLESLVEAYFSTLESVLETKFESYV